MLLAARGVAWGTPRRQLTLAPLHSGKGERWIQMQMVESQTKEKEDNQERKCNFCSSFFLLTGIYVLEGLHKNLTDSVSVSVLSVGKACPCTGIMLTSLCLANKSLRVAQRVGSISAVNNVASC